MRLSNNIHNVVELESAELTQEWEEEEKIPVKMGPSTPAPKAEEKKEEAKTDANPEGAKADGDEGPTPPPEGTTPAEGDAKKAEPVPEPVAEQQYETKIRFKKNIVPIKFTTSSFAMTPNIKKQH